jgi:hypothetical protein
MEQGSAQYAQVECFDCKVVMQTGERMVTQFMTGKTIRKEKKGQSTELSRVLDNRKAVGLKIAVRKRCAEVLDSLAFHLSSTLRRIVGL